jgi:hypothetical protein
MLNFSPDSLMGQFGSHVNPALRAECGVRFTRKLSFK